MTDEEKLKAVEKSYRDLTWAAAEHRAKEGLLRLFASVPPETPTFEQAVDWVCGKLAHMDPPIPREYVAAAMLNVGWKGRVRR